MDTGPLYTQVPSYRERKVQLMSLNLSEKKDSFNRSSSGSSRGLCFYFITIYIFV